MINSPPIPVHAAPGLNLGDIYYILFRHKKKILLCCAAGLAAAAAAYRLNPPPYQSEAKLFVRYIISESKALGSVTRDSAAKSPDQRGETIMNSEMEILSSLDLARQVAEAVGPEKILAKLGGGRDIGHAIAVIKGNLSVNVAPASSVIHVIFKHPDPEVVQPVLREVIDRYLKLHVDTHTASGMLGDFLSQETDQLRARLSQTEDELRKASNKAGVISLEDAKKSLSEQRAGIRRDLYSTQAELAQRRALFEEISKRIPAQSAQDLDAPVPPEILVEYRSLTSQLDLLQKMEQELLTQFTAENVRVKELRVQIAEAEAKRRSFHERFPRITQMSTTSPGADAADAATVATQINALQTKAKVLTAQLEEVGAEIAKVEQMEGTIVELRRKKELEEANYRYYAASLEQSRINETLGNGRVSNISQIQTPAPPFSDRTRTNKLIGLIAGAGVIGGIVWAFMIELYLDRSIKRPVDIERTLRAPLLLSIPALSRKHRLQAPALMLHGGNGHNGHAPNGAKGTEIATAEAPHPLQVFHETLRDRLIGYFESINLTHKPKLVAVTGLGANSGVTTTAAGLARSLSETGEGNVLLVDMNVGQGIAQHFTKGKAVCGIDELLDSRDNAHVDENLYVAAETGSDRLTRNLPQRFSRLVPKLKASDFDYIIFDMPPVSQISITPRLASFMDMVLLVVESEKSDRSVVQRAAALLAESRAHVGVVLNKTRSYVPSRLYQENLAIS